MELLERGTAAQGGNGARQLEERQPAGGVRGARGLHGDGSDGHAEEVLGQCGVRVSHQSRIAIGHTAAEIRMFYNLIF